MLSYGTDFSTYHTLIPTDNSADNMGCFPCGAEEGLYSKIFQFPDGLLVTCAPWSGFGKTMPILITSALIFRLMGGKIMLAMKNAKAMDIAMMNFKYVRTGGWETFVTYTKASPIHILILFVMFFVLLVVVFDFRI